MTDAGNQLLTQANANGVGVVIDSLVISNNNPQGTLSQTDKSFFSITIPINAKTSQGDTLQVEAVLNNTNFSADYPVNTIGITAHMQNDNNSVLLAIAEADSAIIIPASADIQYTQYFDFSITNDKQANITAEINPAGVVSNDAFSNAVNSLSATNSNNTSSLSNAFSSYASNDSVNSKFNSVNVQLSNYATSSSVANQIASTESYANSVAVSAAIGSTNWVNTLANGTDMNTAIGVGRYVLLPNGNYGNFPSQLDATQQGYMEVIPDVYGNVSQNVTIPGNHVQTIRFKRPSGWTNWTINATTNDTNSAYQNAVNTASAYTNQQTQSAVNTAQLNASNLLNGYNSPIPLNSCDLNSVTNPGVYELIYTNSYENVPSPSFNGSNALLIVEKESSDVYQTIKRGTSNLICYRANNALQNNWNNWQSSNPLDVPNTQINKGDSLDNYKGQYVHLNINGLNLSTDIGGNNGLPNIQIYGDFISIPNINATSQYIHDNIGNIWYRIAGGNWIQK